MDEALLLEDEEFALLLESGEEIGIEGSGSFLAAFSAQIRIRPSLKRKKKKRKKRKVAIK